jgi:hypothetical protein
MKIIITENQLKVISEAFTQTDKTEIERIIRKEIKDALDDSKFKKKIKDYMDEEHKSRDFEKKLVEVSKNVLVQLFKQMYNKRSVWTSGLSNDPS